MGVPGTEGAIINSAPAQTGNHGPCPLSTSEGAAGTRHDVTSVQPTEGRTDVHVRFLDEGAFAGPIGLPVEYFVQRALQEHPNTDPAMAVLLDGRLRELTTPIQRDVDARIVPITHFDGSRIYRRSLTLLLLAAVQRCFPDARIAVEHSLPFGAYFCTVDGRFPFTAQELEQIEEEMWRLVEADLPITTRRVALEEALALFESDGDESKVKLLAHRRKDDLAIYTLDGIQNYFHGYMAPSTGYLRWFGLAEYGPGFLLRFPRRQDPTTLQPIQPSDKLVNVFLEYADWMRNMELRNLGSLNNAIAAERIGEIVLISEALHERRIARIASVVAESWRESEEPDQRIRVVLVSGPSSSGKTTFAKRLSIQLLAYGIRPYALSLDNYFVNRVETPVDEDGRYDFESLNALDLALLNQHLAVLFAGHEVTLPFYNFKTGMRETGETTVLAPNQVLIIEGIHGLNPDLAASIPRQSTLRVYVSVLTHLNLDRHNRIPTSDVRLLRRIVRDRQHRGYTATDTINNWANVRRGEERNIFPFQNNADAIFNSALIYELSVLRTLAEPLLLQVDRDMPAYTEARRLLAFLQWIRPANSDLVPDNSIIREFIGGSILRRVGLA